MEDLNTQVLRTAVNWSRETVPVALVTVARTWGSSPRPPGSLMAINGRGETVGSVSGGCIEDDLIERVRQGGLAAISEEARPTVVRYGISADQAHRFGLPCGGTIELVLEPVQANSRLEELLQRCQMRQCTERILDLSSGQVVLREGHSDGVPELTEKQFTTFLGPVARLILIGAGDLSRFMTEIALGLGFEVLVCDPREGQLEGWVGQAVTLSHEMPDDLILRVQPDARTAVVALTHDPKLDDLALMDALRSKAFYVGAIGSRQNSRMRRDRLNQHFGLSHRELDRLRSPAGIFIGCKTPAEIALSIMAELVAVKNGIEQGRSNSVAIGKSRYPTRQVAQTAASCGI